MSGTSPVNALPGCRWSDGTDELPRAIDLVFGRVLRTWIRFVLRIDPHATVDRRLCHLVRAASLVTTLAWVFSPWTVRMALEVVDHLEAATDLALETN